MTDIVTLARPYARAAYEVAKADGAIEPWAAFLNAAVTLVKQEQIQALLNAPEVDHKACTALFIKMLKVTDKKQKNFLSVLAGHQRLVLLSGIVELFMVARAEDLNSVKVEVSAACVLEQEQQSALVAAIADHFKKEVMVQVAVDESLLGGAVIKVGDTVIDGSIKGKLARLKETMK